MRKILFSFMLIAIGAFTIGSDVNATLTATVKVDKLDALGHAAEDVRSFGLVFNQKVNAFSIKLYELPNNEIYLEIPVHGGVSSYYISPGNWSKKLNLGETYKYSISATAQDTNDTYFYENTFNTEGSTNSLETGDLFKMEDYDHIYQLRADGKRDVVPYTSGDYRQAVMDSWGMNANNAKVVSQEVVESYILGRNIPIKAGTSYSLKKQNEDKYYISLVYGELTEVDRNNYSHYMLVTIPDPAFQDYNVVSTLPQTNIIISDINGGINSNQNQATIYWTTGATQSECTVNYSKNSNLSNGTTVLGRVIQYPTSTNNGKYHYDALISNLTTGNYYYKIMCGASSESSIHTLQNGQQVDLIVSNVDEDTDNNTISITIKNIGSSGASIVNSIVKVILGSNYHDKILNCSPDDVSCLTYNNNRVDEYSAGINAGAYGKSTLAPNEEYSILFNKASYLLQDLNFQSGKTYMIKAYVDYRNGVNESNENNNTFTKTITVVQDQPDLIISSVSMQYDQNLNRINGKAVIKNIGNGEAKSIYNFVGLRIEANDSSSSFDWESLEVDSNRVLLRAGESKEYDFIVNPQSLKENYNNKITFYIDRNNAPQNVFSEGHVSESNEYNNTLTKYINIGHRYMTKIADIQGPKYQYQPKEPIKLTIKGIKDNGEPASSNNGYHIQYYTYPQNGGERLEEYIQAGQYNASYQNGYWNINYLAPQNHGNYYTEITLYCSLENSFCWNNDRGVEVKRKLNFTVSGNAFDDTINDQAEIKLGDGTYELSEEDKIKLGNGLMIEPVYFISGSGSNEFRNVKFDVYEGATKLGTTDFTRVGWDSKEFSFKGSWNREFIFQVYVSSLGQNNGTWESKITFKSLDEEEVEIKEDIKEKPTPQNQGQAIKEINQRAKDLLGDNKLDSILAELKQLRSLVKEQQTQIKHLSNLVKNVQEVSEKAQTAISNFITYGVDDNTQKLGEGERAAVMFSYKAAFNKLPETEEELADAIKIANGRWPSTTSEEAEKEAKTQFKKIYKRDADMNQPNDNAAVTVMAYGLRQKAENRKLESEKQGIKTFEHIYGYHPKSTEDWNIMQAITYSGATR